MSQLIKACLISKCGRCVELALGALHKLVAHAWLQGESSSAEELMLDDSDTVTRVCGKGQSDFWGLVGSFRCSESMNLCIVGRNGDATDPQSARILGGVLNGISVALFESDTVTGVWGRGRVVWE